MERRTKKNKKFNYRNIFGNMPKDVRKKFFHVALILFFCVIFVFAFFNMDSLSPKSFFIWLGEDVLGFGSGGGYPVMIDGVSVENGNFKAIGSNLCMVSDISVSKYNKKGRMIANEQHSFANPKLKLKGKYSILWNIGGKGIQIGKNSKTVFSRVLENDILSSDISEKGNYIVANKSKGYLSEITLYSNKNEEQYKYYFSECYVTDVSLNDKGNLAVVSAISSENTDMKSVIYVFDFKSETPKSVSEYKGNMLFSVSFMNNKNLVVVGDKGLVFMDASKDVSNEFSFEQKILKCFKFSPSEGMALVLSNTEYGHSCNVVSFDVKGNKQLDVETEVKVKDVSLKKQNIAVLGPEIIFRYNLNGDLKSTVDVSKDGKQIELASSNVAYVLGVSEAYKISL